MTRLKQLLLIFGDLFTLYIGLYLAIILRYLNLESVGIELAKLIKPMAILFFLAIIINFIIGLYDLSSAKNNKIFFKKILITALAWLIIGILYFYVKPNNNVSPKTILLLTTIAGFGIMSIWRFLYNKFVSTNILQTSIVFIGMSNETKELISIIEKEPQRGYVIKGLIEEKILNFDTNIPISKNIAEVKEKNNNQNPQLIVLSPSMANNKELQQELYSGLFKQTSVIDLAQFYEEITQRIPPFTFSAIWFIINLQEQKKKIYDRARIIFDLIAATIMGLFFIITFPFIATAIKLNSSGPIFFTQTRVGLLDKIFTIYKYRTMQALGQDGSAEIDGPRFADYQDSRITLVGKFLRKTRLDEIPQFINIWQRQMSIIGPRPERPEFVSVIKETMPFYSLRHLIKPGLTGWAQIKHGYTGSINENLRKLEYDLYYIKNRGLFLDVVILLKTINIIARLAGR